MNYNKPHVMRDAPPRTNRRKDVDPNDLVTVACKLLNGLVLRANEPIEGTNRFRRFSHDFTYAAPTTPLGSLEAVACAIHHGLPSRRRS